MRKYENPAATRLRILASKGSAFPWRDEEVREFLTTAADLINRQRDFIDELVLKQVNPPLILSDDAQREVVFEKARSRTELEDIKRQAFLNSTYSFLWGLIVGALTVYLMLR